MAKEAPSVANPHPKPLDLIGILKEAIMIPFQNINLMVSILLLILLPFLSLHLSHNLVAAPFLIKLECQDSDVSAFRTNFETVASLEAIYLIAFCVLELCTMIMTIYASAAAYSGKHLNLMGVLKWIAATWKGPAITWVYIVLIIFTHTVLVMMIIVAFALITNGGPLIALISLLGFSAMLFYLYLASICTLGLVISVVEEEFSGIRAIQEAAELIKGRKLQGFGLMVFSVLLVAPIYLLLSLNMMEDDIEAVTKSAIAAVETVLLCLVKVFSFIIYTVFYFECKKSHGEKIDMQKEGKCVLVSNELPV